LAPSLGKGKVDPRPVAEETEGIEIQIKFRVRNYTKDLESIETPSITIPFKISYFVVGGGTQIVMPPLRSNGPETVFFHGFL
jgi:hypothetical protein